MQGSWQKYLLNIISIFGTSIFAGEHLWYYWRHSLGGSAGGVFVYGAIRHSWASVYLRAPGFLVAEKLIVSGVIWLFCGHTLISCRQKYNHWNVKTQWIHLVKTCSRKTVRRCLLFSCVLFDIWSIRKMELNFNLTLNKIKEAIDSYEKISTHVLCIMLNIGMHLIDTNKESSGTYRIFMNTIKCEI